ncbi:MAG TPA: hypothetical protein VIO36_12240 [Anaerolineaceae bacterium]
MWRLFLIVLFLPFLVTQPAAAQARATEYCDLVVLSDPADPYYPLAQEIAAAEGVLLANSLPQALDCGPVHLAWVVSPAFLSDTAFIQFGQAMLGQPSAVSTGIITASTLDGARALWQRAADAGAERSLAVNAENPAAHIYQGRILGGDLEEERPLTLDSLRSVLAEADYLTYTGHGSSSYLRLDEETTLTAANVPALDGLVIGTGSCQTVRPWNEGSISLAFVDQGAAAYVGFAYSPNEGFLIGEFSGLPFRYTWPGFTLGQVVQAQNRGTLQGYASIPYQYLLGDPRVALQTGPPYRVEADVQAGLWREVRLSGLPAGVVPVRIRGGAEYAFVQVVGITAAADGDPFYNSRMQSANIRGDRFLLVEQPGGSLTLRLRERAPFYWYPVDMLLDAFDDTFIFSPQSQGDVLGLAVCIPMLLWVGWQALQKRLTRKKVLLAVCAGVGAAVLQAGYSWLRLDDVTIISKTVVFSPLSVLAAFLLALCGALIFFQARRWPGRLAGVLAATFFSWAAAVTGLVVIGLGNQLAFVPKLGVPLYNYSIGLMPLLAFAVTGPLAALAFAGLRQAANHSA